MLSLLTARPKTYSKTPVFKDMSERQQQRFRQSNKNQSTLLTSAFTSSKHEQKQGATSSTSAQPAVQVVHATASSSKPAAKPKPTAEAGGLHRFGFTATACRNDASRAAQCCTDESETRAQATGMFMNPIPREHTHLIIPLILQLHWIPPYNRLLPSSR